MKKVLLSAMLCAGVVSLAAGEPQTLVPRAVLFGNPTQTQPRLSPDGARISWLAASSSGVLNVWARSFDGGDAKPVTDETHRPVGWYDWARDGRHVLYLQDQDGDEIDHLFSADLESGNIRDLTPFRGVRAQNVMTSPRRPGEVLVALNLRDRHAFDVYRVDLGTGAVTLEAENPGDVLSWATDASFVVRGATAFDPGTARSIVRVRASSGEPWRDLVVMPFEKALFDGQVVGGSLIAGFSPDGRTVYVHSALSSDKGRLVSVDTATGRETGVVAEDPGSDVADDVSGDEPAVIVNPSSGALEAVQFDPAERRWQLLDAAVRADLERIGREAPGFLRLVSRDSSDRKWIVSVSRSDAPTCYYTYDRETKRATLLFGDNPALGSFHLAAKKPVLIPARDGMKLVSYLTLPPGAGPRGLPLVLLVHGGPNFRDTADFDPEVQLLANRGYAVLQVNYRGSTGFGLAYLNAGTRQWGLGMQNDLYDAVEWAVKQGVAAPGRIASMGWSGGGFATLHALEQRPDLLACGVDGVGPADVATLLRSFPAYWSAIVTRWRLRIGDADHDESWNRKISPLYHVDSIRAPLLIGQGAHDPRVTIANADAMVKALRDARREVVYVVYPDEGHGFARPENNMDFYGRVEEFLARKLGGRAEPYGEVQGSTAELR
jgi:dipeptidyl aminopeptidase/acylaminoacyl peptidase